MIETVRFSQLKFNEQTETLGFSQEISLASVLPVGKEVKSRFSSIEIIYVPDESKEIDTEWLSRRVPKSGEDVFAVCESGFAHYQSDDDQEVVRARFLVELGKETLFGPEAQRVFEESGFPPFFELESIVFVRKEDAVIYGGCLEDFFHLAEHGVDIAAVGDSVEFGGNCDFDYLFESSPYE